MRLITVLLLLSAFALAACASQENIQQPGETQDEPSQVEGCQFPEPFNCAAHYVLDGSIELFVTQGTGREVVIRDIIVQSDAFSETSPGSGVYHNCSLNEDHKESRFRQKQLFVLDKSTDGSTCTYRDTSSNQNRYAVQIRYSWADENAVNTIDGEFTASLSDSPPSLFSYLDT